MKEQRYMILLCFPESGLGPESRLGEPVLHMSIHPSIYPSTHPSTHFMFLQVDMYAGAIFIQQSLKLDLYLAIAGLLVITAVYTVAGMTE